MSKVESANFESRLCLIENLQFFSPDYVVQAMSYVESHIASRLCSTGYVVCEIEDFRVQAMSSFRVQAIVVQAMYSHQLESVMNESSKVPAKFESIIIIPSGVMNFQSRKLRKKFYTYAHTPYAIIFKI
jgi:hypothetical protein